MDFIVLLMVLRASVSEVPSEIPIDPAMWQCRNQVEVWCSADGCAASEPDGFTPMDINAKRTGDLSVCAYTGCWEGKATVTAVDGHVLWTAKALGFSGNPKASGAAITLLVNQKDGVGFVQAGGLATPVLCERRAIARIADDVE